MNETRSRLKSDPVLRWGMNQDSHHAGFEVLKTSPLGGEYTGGQGQLQVLVLVLAPLTHPCKVPVLFPFLDQGSFFPSCHCKHPEKSARRQTEQPGPHHSFPPWASLPHQGGHLCLSSGDPWLSQGGVTCQEAPGKPHPDHHQHRQKTQPEHWGSSLFPMCWHHCLTKIINRQGQFSTREMSPYYLSLNDYHLVTSEGNSQYFNCSCHSTSTFCRRKFCSKFVECLFVTAKAIV